MLEQRRSKAVRQRLRDAREEWKVIVQRSRALDFDYIVTRLDPPRVCFGSGIERDCLPLTGPALSPFMRKFVPEVRKYPGPLDYNTRKGFLKKFAPKSGYTLLASKKPRTLLVVPSQNIPPVGTYDIDPEKPAKQAAKPFLVGAKLTRRVKLVTPAPGTYSFPKRHTKLLLGFGRERKIFDAIQTICTPFNLAHCHLCEQQPAGDYWRNFATKEDICQPCMQKELAVLRKCGLKSRFTHKRQRELQEYARARYCGFYHEHNGTTAAVQHMPWGVLRKKIHCESYLAGFGY